jgi:predicted component of type VI protein secretion system
MTDWAETAIRDFAEKHGPSGPAWNISAILDCLRRPSPSTVTDEGLVERLNKLKRLEDDVRHYSGNEASGYAEIARRKAELFDELASGHTALLREIEVLREAATNARDMFRFYELEHRAKAEKIEEGSDTIAQGRRAKERRNCEMADKLDAALSSPLDET